MARPRRLRDTDPTRHGLILAWWGFTITFGGIRLLTWLIKIDVAGVGDVSSGGVHLHHYIWGIVIVAVVGALGLVERSPSWRRWLGAAYGVGLALIVDEAALLVQFRDVYWSTSGTTSVAAAVVIIGVVGSVLVVTRSPRRDQDG
jgi:polyferredoxin